MIFEAFPNSLDLVHDRVFHRNELRMKAWAVCRLVLKSTLHYPLEHMHTSRPPSSHFLSFQIFKSGNRNFLQQPIPSNPLVFLIPCADPLFLRSSHYFCSVFQPLEEMPQRAVHERDIHFELLVDLIKSCNKSPKIGTATLAHCLALKVGAIAHLPISTSLITIYSKSGDFDSSRDLFDEIHNRDVITWNAIIAASVKYNYHRSATDFFQKMIEAETGYDSTTLLLMVSTSLCIDNFEQGRAIHCLSIKTGMFVDTSLSNALMDMYAKCGDLNSSERMFAAMKHKDVVSWNSITRGCLYNNDPEKSLRYFKDMVLYGEEADNVSLSCAISASTALGELAFGESIHGQGIKLGYKDSSHVSVANALISLYSQCGDIEAAETLLREMVYKDVVTWNAMMEGYASNKKINEVFDLLLEMQTVGSFQPETITLCTVLPVCAELKLLREGRTIHGFAVRKEMVSDLSLINCLIDMYSTCNCIETAQLLFNSLRERDLVSWNTMISGYSQNGFSKEAKNLFRELLRLCPNHNSSTVFAVLSSCDSHESLHFGKSIHCWQLKLGLLNHIILVNSLIHMYISCGDLTAAFSILQQNSASADTASWNTVIAGCVRGDHFQEALETFSLMRQEPLVNYDSITLVSVLSACANLELLGDGKSLHGLVLKSPLGSDTRIQNSLITMYGRCRDINSARAVFKFFSSPNICSWNCMISSLSQNKRSKEALDIFRDLQFEHNEITIVSILSACAQIGVLRHGKQVHVHAVRSGIQDNSFISAALVDMYSNCGRLDNALQVFRHSKDKSEACWNSMISAYGQHGNGKKAIELFHEMWESGTRVTKSTFVSLLSACSHSGLVNEGVGCYNSMLEKYGVEPVIEHQVYVIDMLGRSGRLDEAYDFTKGLQLHSHSSSGLWGSLLSACNYHGELKLGKQIAQLLFELDPQNVGYYISLSNMYVAAGSWKDATELRHTIQQKRLKKPPGYSLIDVGLAPYGKSLMLTSRQSTI